MSSLQKIETWGNWKHNSGRRSITHPPCKDRWSFLLQSKRWKDQRNNVHSNNRLVPSRAESSKSRRDYSECRMKHHTSTMQGQMKLLTAVEKMKRSKEQCAFQQQVSTIQSRVIEVTQRLQWVQDEACMIFEEVEGQGSQLYQLVVIVE